MNLSQLLATDPPKNISKRRCAVCKLVDSLNDDPGEQNALDTLLRDSRWSYPALSAALREQGFEISVKSLERHIASLCTGRRGNAAMRETR